MTLDFGLSRSYLSINSQFNSSMTQEKYPEPDRWILELALPLRPGRTLGKCVTLSNPILVSVHPSGWFESSPILQSGCGDKMISLMRKHLKKFTRAPRVIGLFLLSNEITGVRALWYLLKTVSSPCSVSQSLLACFLISVISPLRPLLIPKILWFRDWFIVIYDYCYSTTDPSASQKNRW